MEGAVQSSRLDHTSILPCPLCLLHLLVVKLRGGAELSWQDHGRSMEMSLFVGKMDSAHEHCSHLSAPSSAGGGLGVQQHPLLVPRLKPPFCLGMLKTFRNAREIPGWATGSQASAALVEQHPLRCRAGFLEAPRPKRARMGAERELPKGVASGLPGARALGGFPPGSPIPALATCGPGEHEELCCPQLQVRAWGRESS